MTPKQRETLTFIQSFVRANKCAPTQAEIALGLGISQPMVHRRLKALERRGAIERCGGVARGIKLIAASQKDTLYSVGDRSNAQLQEVLGKLAEIEHAVSRRSEDQLPKIST